MAKPILIHRMGILSFLAVLAGGGDLDGGAANQGAIDLTADGGAANQGAIVTTYDGGNANG